MKQTSIEQWRAPQYQRDPKVKFDRARALSETRDDPLLHKTFLALFKEIDELDLTLNFYDLNSGKRKNPPRQELLNAFSAAEIEKLRERANKMSPFKYLKLRHHLVELRREQFTLRDSYKETILRKTPFHVEAKATPLAFDTDIPVLPLGLYTRKLPLAKMFCRRDQLIPSFFFGGRTARHFEIILGEARAGGELTGSLF